MISSWQWTHFTRCSEHIFLDAPSKTCACKPKPRRAYMHTHKRNTPTRTPNDRMTALISLPTWNPTNCNKYILYTLQFCCKKFLNWPSLCQRLGFKHGLWEISHERKTWEISNEHEARVSSAEGARVRRRRKTSKASLSPEAQEVLQSSSSWGR